jgi:queuine tRNA-ribosyltransferase
MESQRKIGADIIMAFDICPPYPSPVKELEKSASITLEWTERALEWLSRYPEIHGYPQHLFGIIQGGYEKEIRARMTNALAEFDLPGYAIGGLSVGEPMPKAYEMADFCTGLMPPDKPRYIMGIGTPKDLLTMIRNGGDMYDCVVPTRNARNGMVWTWQGVLHYKAARYAGDLNLPLDPDCSCYTCRNFSRAYLRHLYKAGELTVLQLASLHNIHFFCDLMRTARERILADGFEKWSSTIMKRWEN